MTLFRLMLASMMLVSTFAQANVITFNRDNNYGPVRPGQPDRGGDYGPIRPGEPGRDDNYQPIPDRGRRDSQEIYVNRYLRNESFDVLRELRGLEGSRIVSVDVYVSRSRDVGALLDLFVNGRSEDSRRAEIGRPVVLQARSNLEVGRQLRSLEVYVRGEMLIDRIVVQLANEGHRPPPYQPPYDGREIAVDLRLPSYLPPQTRLDLTPYVDTRMYRGYAIRAVEITGNSRFGNASLDVLLNGFYEGAVFLNPRISTQTVRSRQNLVIGSSFGSLVLAPRGDSSLMQVRLILSRY